MAISIVHWLTQRPLPCNTTALGSNRAKSQPSLLFRGVINTQVIAAICIQLGNMALPDAQSLPTAAWPAHRAAGGSRPHSQTLSGALHSIFLLHSQRQAIKSLKQLQLSCFTFRRFERILGIKRRTQNRSNCPWHQTSSNQSSLHSWTLWPSNSGARLSVPTPRAPQWHNEPCSISHCADHEAGGIWCWVCAVCVSPLQH